MSKETIYIDAVTKLNEQDVIIKELAELLSDVLEAWNARDYMSEHYELFMKANKYLMGLENE
jgi:hypothetical protein